MITTHLFVQKEFSSLTRNYKQKIAASILVLATMLLLVTFNLSGNLVKAQTSADSVTVIIPPSIGGTTNPAAGTYTYTTNDTQTLTAIPDSGYVFQYFIVSGDYTSGHTPAVPTNVTDPDTGEVIGVFPSLPSSPATGIDNLVITANPILISHGFGYTYTWQAVFASISSTSPTPPPSGQGSSTVTVVIEPTTGGTTNPASGTYTYTTTQPTQTLTATPSAGYVFKYFIVSGDFTSGHTPVIPTNFTDPATGEDLGVIPTFPRLDLTGIDSLVITTNPITISHGFGYTYTWQAVFEPISTTSPSPTAIATASPTTTPTQSATPIATTSPEVTSTPGGNGGLSTEVIAAIVVVIIIIIIVAVVVVMMMRRKK
jgi:hypothetical protein